MLRRLVNVITSAALVLGTMPPPLYAQTSAAAASGASATTADAGAEAFNIEQLDALLAPIALFPDALLTQVLMAATNPLEIVSASRWLEQGSNRDLKGPALEAALKNQNWDPSVKSLIPFPQVLGMLNQNLDWTQQLGYAMYVQQVDVFDSVQRLRLQAQRAGNLQSTPQQIVRTEPAPPGAPHQIIIIEPAQPEIVFVPVYNPNTVFGTWPYRAVPPVYFPPPPGVVAGNALIAGLMFGAGVAITAGLWGWARPNWGCCWGGSRNSTNVNINVNRWNTINVNRPWQGGSNGNWRPTNPNLRPGGNNNRPGGPVGRPTRPGGLPPNAIGRPDVTVPGGVVRPPGGMGPGNRPGIGQPNDRPGGGQGINRPGQGADRDRPGIGQPNDRPGGGQGINRPGQGADRDRPGIGQGGEAGRSRPGQGADSASRRPSEVARPGGGVGQDAGANRPGAGRDRASRPARQPPAFSNMNDGGNARQFGNRGSQSRQMDRGGRQDRGRQDRGGGRNR